MHYAQAMHSLGVEDDMDGAVTKGRFFHTVSALALGALVGTLVGLSIDAVVGSTLTALLALLAGYFGLRENENASEFAAIRITLFSLACLLTIPLSLYVRTHNLLSPSLEADLSGFKARNVLNDQDIRSVVLFKKYGLIPAGFTSARKEAAADDTVLFANPDAWECTHLQAELFPDPKSRLEAMRSAGGAWARLADQVAGADAAQHVKLMQLGFERLCGQ